MRTFPALISVFVFLLCSFSDADKSKWTLQKNEQGVTVYMRPHEGTDIKEIRVVSTVKSTLSSIVALLLDSKNYTEWIYACKEARTLKAISDLEIFQYSVTSIPVPFQNRDMIVHLKISQDPQTKIVSTQSISKPDYIPVVDGIERIKGYKSQYRLTPLQDGSVKVEMEMYVEPGGNVPDWLINSTIVKGPFSTTVAMVEQLKKTKYQNATVQGVSEVK